MNCNSKINKIQIHNGFPCVAILSILHNYLGAFVDVMLIRDSIYQNANKKKKIIHQTYFTNIFLPIAVFFGSNTSHDSLRICIWRSVNFRPVVVSWETVRHLFAKPSYDILQPMLSNTLSRVSVYVMCDVRVVLTSFLIKPLSCSIATECP